MTPPQRIWYACDGKVRDAALAHFAAQQSGPKGWLAGEGGLLGNLRVWENMILAAAHHGAALDAAMEARLQQGLACLGWDAAASSALFQSTVAALDGETTRKLLALRTLAAQPALVLVQCEWFHRSSTATLDACRMMLDQGLPNARWIALGTDAPPAAWGFQSAPLSELNHALER